MLVPTAKQPSKPGSKRNSLNALEQPPPKTNQLVQSRNSRINSAFKSRKPSSFSPLDKINVQFRQRKINRRVEMALDMMEAEDLSLGNLQPVTGKFDYA